MQAKDTERHKIDDRQYLVTCVECDKEFEATRSDASYCSARCRKQAHMRPVKKQSTIAEMQRIAAWLREKSYEYRYSKDVYEAMQQLANTVNFALENFEIASNTGEKHL
jgi:hypothetical protein